MAPVVQRHLDGNRILVAHPNLDVVVGFFRRAGPHSVVVPGKGRFAATVAGRILLRVGVDSWSAGGVQCV